MAICMCSENPQQHGCEKAEAEILKARLVKCVMDYSEMDLLVWVGVPTTEQTHSH
jgi:hypothetical protein